MSTPYAPPSSILIIGSGVFGLSTAHALSKRPLFSKSQITVLDRSPFPSPDGSSIDSSRIIRADYSDPAYASLAAEAQDTWRDTSTSGLGGQGRYSENGLVLVADSGRQGEKYVKESFENVKRIMSHDEEAVKVLGSKETIEKFMGTGGGSGEWGYVNVRSGWADAEASMRWLRSRVEATGRVYFEQGEAKSLLRDGKQVYGARLKDGRELIADLVIVAAGAWSGALVDLRGRATASGQVMAYLDLTAEEQEDLGGKPILLDLSTGMFVIPPRNKVLKVARHGYGYCNPVSIPNPDLSASSPDPSTQITVSLPRTSYDSKSHLDIPQEGKAACRQALERMLPRLSNRPFSHTRICWYTDTPRGDFLITYHPNFSGLFLATGGSGHGFKFLPVIGDRIVDVLEKKEGKEIDTLREQWTWPNEKAECVVTEDGSRGGRSGMLLDEELRRI